MKQTKTPSQTVDTIVEETIQGRQTWYDGHTEQERRLIFLAIWEATSRAYRVGARHERSRHSSWIRNTERAQKKRASK